MAAIKKKASIKKRPIQNNNVKPTKKEISKAKEAGRKKRKAAADERKKSAPIKEYKNPVTVTKNADGTFTFHGKSLSPTRDKNAALAPYGMVVHDEGIKLMVLPEKAQGQKFAQFIGCSRFVRNNYLDERTAYYKETGQTLSVAVYKKDYLNKLKKEYPWLKEPDKFALEAACEQVDAAYKNFFDGRASFPQYASRRKPNGNHYTTKQTNDNIGIGINADGRAYVKIPKVGEVLCILPNGKGVLDICPPGARITKATVSREEKTFYVSLSIETVIEAPVMQKHLAPYRVIGMDLGIKEFCIFTDGSGGYEHVENPKWIKKHERRLRRLQKALARKKYDKKTHRGSKNWEKARRKVAKEQRKIANQRLDMEHKLSRHIADRCDAFVCEDLNIKGLMKNRRMSKAIASVGWNQFLTFVKYKLERKGGYFLKVGRFYASSQICAHCGHQNPITKDLKVRDVVCPKCGHPYDRDENASENIRSEGIRLLAEQGVEVSKSAA